MFVVICGTAMMELWLVDNLDMVLLVRENDTNVDHEYAHVYCRKSTVPNMIVYALMIGIVNQVFVTSYGIGYLDHASFVK